MLQEPPRELIDFVSNNFLGKPYVSKGSEINDASFSCWSLIWHYEKLCGLILPYDPWEAVKQFIRVRGSKPQWRDILRHKNFGSPLSHLGVVEMPNYVLHCNNMELGVVRDETYFPPWEDADVWRPIKLL